MSENKRSINFGQIDHYYYVRLMSLCADFGFSMKDFIEEACCLFFDIVDEKGVSHFEYLGDEYRKFYESHRVDPSVIISRVRAAARDAERAGIVFSSHYLFAEDRPEPERKCFEPWLTFGVRVDGRVFTCCGMLDSMGDLAAQTFEEIWNGERYRALRRKLAAGQFPECCRFCIAENRASHFNEDLLTP